jgi:ABC-type polysaccharide/polyol phosphate export permease
MIDNPRFPISPTWMEVTPSGRRMSPLTATQRWAEFKVHLSQLNYLVRWNLVEKSFGRVLGRLWVALDPLMQTALYLFLLLYIFRLQGSDISFTFVLASITFWRLHANLVLGAPTIFHAKSTLLQQSSFAPRLIVYEFLMTEVAFFVINLLIALVVITAFGTRPSVFWLLLPVVLAVQIAFSASLVIFVAMLGTVLRDIGAILVFIVTVWFYLSPVIYGVSRVPPELQRVMALNPFAVILPAYQAILFEHHMPSFVRLGVVFAVSAALVWGGFAALARAQHYFYRFL